MRWSRAEVAAGATALALLAGCGAGGGRTRAGGDEPRHTAHATCVDVADVTAGSGLVRLTDRLLIVQDAAAAVALVAPDTLEVARVALDGDGRDLPKKEKPDFEAAVRLGDVVHVIGSGSAERRRRVARLEVGGDQIIAIELIDAGPLHDALAVALGGAPNIEGAVARGDRVLLFHRGAGADASAVIDAPLASLEGRAPGALRARRLELGRIGDVRLTVTDAAVRGDRIFYLAVAEDTPNAIDDGPIVGAAIGVLDGPQARIVEGRRPSTRKLEGLVMGDDGRHAWAISDPDDERVAAALCRVELPVDLR